MFSFLIWAYNKAQSAIICITGHKVIYLFLRGEVVYNIKQLLNLFGCLALNHTIAFNFSRFFQCFSCLHSSQWDHWVLFLSPTCMYLVVAYSTTRPWLKSIVFQIYWPNEYSGNFGQFTWPNPRVECLHKPCRNYMISTLPLTSFWPCLWHGVLASSPPLPTAWP